MTGDGKSLAAYLPVFQQQKHVIAMYPTNELVQDQCSAFPKYERNLHIRLPRYDSMYSDKISQLMREHNTSIRLEEVRKLLERNSILLTNPDLIHLMMSHQYGWDHMRKELPVTIGAYFDYFLFDEFHVFGVPQVISVLNMLGYLTVNYREKPADRKKFVFLSATPSRLMNKLLERGGLRYKKIEGSYCSSEQPGYRRILQPCELELHEISQETPTETWIEEHLAEVLSFFNALHLRKIFSLVPRQLILVLISTSTTSSLRRSMLAAFCSVSVAWAGMMSFPRTGLTHLFHALCLSDSHRSSVWR